MAFTQSFYALSAISIIFGSYFIPWLLRYPVLLGTGRQWSPDAQFLQLKDTCQPLFPEKLIGCEKFVIINHFLFAACVGSWETRRHWFPPMGALNTSVGPPGAIRDIVYRLNLDTRTLIRLSTYDFPQASDFSVHGMDVIETSPGYFSLFVVNHQRNGSVIELFYHDSSTFSLNHVKTFNGSEQGLHNPNDVYAIPISTKSPPSHNAFFVTNDRYFKWFKLGRRLEDFLRLPTGSVFYHSASTGFKQIIPWIPYANGINGYHHAQGMKEMPSSSSNTLFVAAIMDGTISVFQYDDAPDNIVNRKGFLKVKKIVFDFVMDNLMISSDKQWLYLTGHGEPTMLAKHWSKPAQIASPSIAYRMSLAELRGGFFGKKGEVGEPIVQRLLVDRTGSLINATTTSVADETRNKYWITGLTSQGILECELHSHQRESQLLFPRALRDEHSEDADFGFDENNAVDDDE